MHHSGRRSGEDRFPSEQIFLEKRFPAISHSSTAIFWTDPQACLNILYCGVSFDAVHEKVLWRTVLHRVQAPVIFAILTGMTQPWMYLPYLVPSARCIVPDTEMSTLRKYYLGERPG